MGQRLFVIDEDAYQLLNEYLDTLRSIFAATPGQEETADDIEYRAAELLEEARLASHSASINLQQVESVISRIGSPDEIMEGEDLNIGSSDAPGYAGNSNPRAGEACAPPPFVEMPDVKRKFYRDSEDSIIGGVCSGIAAYFGIDVTWVRIAAIILAIFSFSTVAIIYVVICCIVPVAKTPYERMQLYGESPSLSDLGKSFTRKTEETNNNVREFANRQRSGFASFMKLSVKVIATIALGIMGVIGGCCALGIFFLLIALIISVVTSGWEHWALVPSWQIFGTNLIDNEVPEIIGAIFVLSAILIPIAVLGIGLYRSLGKQKTLKVKPLLLWGVIWIMTIILASIMLN